jgi:hypothetical protein
MHKPQVAAKAKSYGVRSVPAVVDGNLAVGADLRKMFLQGWFRLEGEWGLRFVLDE